MGGVFVVGHVNHRVAAARQQHAAVMVHHLREARDKHLIVRAKHALWAQNSKARVRVGLRQQLDHLFAGGFTAGELVGKTVRAEIFFDIPMVVIVKVE